jgi:hypothetical protein
MEGSLVDLRKELEASMRRTAELKVELDQAEGRLPKSGVPHYTLIENAAHEVGQLVSRMIQQQAVNELVAACVPVSKCPTCATRCPLQPTQREVLSGDGRVKLQELVGHCPACRRDFFPLA